MSSLMKPPSPSPPTYSASRQPTLDCNAAQLQLQLKREKIPEITLYFENSKLCTTSLSLWDKWTDDRMTARVRKREKEREIERGGGGGRGGGGLDFLRTSEALPTIYP